MKKILTLANAVIADKRIVDLESAARPKLNSQ